MLMCSLLINVGTWFLKHGIGNQMQEQGFSSLDESFQTTNRYTSVAVIEIIPIQIVLPKRCETILENCNHCETLLLISQSALQILAFPNLTKILQSVHTIISNQNLSTRIQYPQLRTLIFILFQRNEFVVASFDVLPNNMQLPFNKHHPQR